MKAIATRCSPVSHLHPSIANKIANLSQPAQGKSQLALKVPAAVYNMPSLGIGNKKLSRCAR